MYEFVIHVRLTLILIINPFAVVFTIRRFVL